MTGKEGQDKSQIYWQRSLSFFSVSFLSSLLLRKYLLLGSQDHHQLQKQMLMMLIFRSFVASCFDSVSFVNVIQRLDSKTCLGSRSQSTWLLSCCIFSSFLDCPLVSLILCIFVCVFNSHRVVNEVVLSSQGSHLTLKCERDSRREWENHAEKRRRGSLGRGREFCQEWEMFWGKTRGKYVTQTLWLLWSNNRERNRVKNILSCIQWISSFSRHLMMKRRAWDDDHDNPWKEPSYAVKKNQSCKIQLQNFEPVASFLNIFLPQR